MTPSDLFHVRPRWCSTALCALSVATMVTACGTLKTRAEAVQITASDRDVTACERIGPVALGSFETEFEQRQRDLRFETARRGGNVLLVDPFATATTGTAYVCDQPLNPLRTSS